MKYKVPKFLERETKFFNFFTFKQLAVVGGIGLVLFILYYIVPRGLFFFLVFLSAAIIAAFIFVRIEGFSLTQIIVQFVGFFTSSKRYYWQKKDIIVQPKIIKKQEPESKEKQESLKLSPQGKIKSLSSKIEMGIK